MGVQVPWSRWFAVRVGFSLPSVSPSLLVFFGSIPGTQWFICSRQTMPYSCQPHGYSIGSRHAPQLIFSIWRSVWDGGGMDIVWAEHVTFCLHVR